MYESLSAKLLYVAPILMHNGRLSNPLDPIVKEIKKVTGKRKKTDADHETLSALEWVGSLYTTEDISVEVGSGGTVKVIGGGRLCIPSENIEGMLINAAKKNRQGEIFKSAVLVDGVFPLEYTGPKSIQELAQKNGFRDVRRVKVQKSAIMRTRPIIRDWSVTVTIQYLKSLLNERDILDTLVLAGQIIGCGDYRPKFGRFSVEQV